MGMSRVLRWLLVVGCAAGGAFLLSACNPLPPAKMLVVTTTADGLDANVGDGVCEATVGAGDCTLRAAVQEANASPIRVDITVPPWTYQLTPIDPLNLYLDPVSDNVVMHAPQPGALVVTDPSNDPSVLFVNRGTVTVTGIGFGGRPNQVVADEGATLTLGAVSADSLRVMSGATVHALDSAFDGYTDSVGVTNDGTFDAHFSTMYGLWGGPTSTASIGASIVRNVCIGPMTSLGYNLFPVDGTYTLNTCPSGVGDVASDAMGLSRPSADHLSARVPQLGSPALDAIPAGVGPCAGSPPSDLHGHARPTNGACDRGAIEAQAPRSFTVDTSVDARDAAAGDGVCRTTAGACSLRAAIDEANRRIDVWSGNVISLAAAPTLTIAGADDDANASGDFDLTGNVTIEGNGYTIDAHQLDRVLDHRNGDLTIRHLGIAGGRVSGPDSLGGGVRSSVSRVLLEDDTLSGNTLSGNYTYGAGVGVDRGSIVVRRSTFTGNSTTGYGGSGGGVYGRSYEPSGDSIDVSESTFVGNTAFSGAAVDNIGVPSQEPISVRSSTFVDNMGGTALGGINTTTVSGSVFSGGHVLCFNDVVSLGWNVTTASDACFVAQPTDLIVSDVLLGPLAANGGPTQTLLPQVGSPLLDLIPVGTAGLCDSSATVDQRGSVRPHGAACDVGSVER